MASSSSTSGSGVPPGFRFHPTDEELLHYYLKKKISFEKFELEVIREVDLNRMEPWELQERCKIGSAPQNEWYFFSHKDRKYPTGSRTNRATNAGFWKATGRDKCIRDSYRKIGMRKTLVFYRGRAPHGQKTDWIMHEYRLEDTDDAQLAAGSEDGWVVCRVFKKKHFFKIGGTSGGGGGSGGIQGMEDHMYLPSMATNPSHPPHPYLHPEQQHHHFNSSRMYRPPDLGLQYSQLQSHHYSQIQVQNLLPDHRQPPPSYDFSVLPGEPAGITELDVGDGNEQIQHVGEGGDENDWTMLGRFNGTTATAGGGGVHHMNQMPSSRGEMDLWGYGK